MTKDEAKEKIINDFCKCRVWCELYPDMCQMESCEIWWALKALSDRPTEEWIGEADGYADGELVYDTWYCSNCGYVVDDDEPPTWNYCPNCGSYNGGGQSD